MQITSGSNHIITKVIYLFIISIATTIKKSDMLFIVGINIQMNVECQQINTAQPNCTYWFSSLQ